MSKQEKEKLSQHLLYLLITTFPHPKHYLLNYVWFILVNIVCHGFVSKEDAVYSMNALVLISYCEDLFKTTLKSGYTDFHFTPRLIIILENAKTMGFWDNDYKLFKEELEELLKIKKFENEYGIDESNYKERFMHYGKCKDDDREISKVLIYGLEHNDFFDLTLHESLILYLTILDIEEGNYKSSENNIIKKYFDIFKSSMEKNKIEL